MPTNITFVHRIYIYNATKWYIGAPNARTHFNNNFMQTTKILRTVKNDKSLSSSNPIPLYTFMLCVFHQIANDGGSRRKRETETEAEMEKKKIYIPKKGL